MIAPRPVAGSFDEPCRLTCTHSRRQAHKREFEDNLPFREGGQRS
jgi:hypothetical protein